MKSIQESIANRKKSDADDRFAASIADDLRVLPENLKILAKHEIRNVVFKYQVQELNAENNESVSQSQSFSHSDDFRNHSSYGGINLRKSSGNSYHHIYQPL